MSKASKRSKIAVPTVAEDRKIRATATADPDARPLSAKQLKSMVPLSAPRPTKVRAYEVAVVRAVQPGGREVLQVDGRWLAVAYGQRSSCLRRPPGSRRAKMTPNVAHAADPLRRASPACAGR